MYSSLLSGQRINGKATDTYKKSVPFQVKRWHVDEADTFSSPRTEMPEPPPRAIPSTSNDITIFAASPSTADLGRVMTSPPGSQLFDVNFPLPSDRLLHLIQYNVFRAFVHIKRILNTISLDPKTCPVFGPCLDDTTRYPPNPNIPSSLAPTFLQQT
ncbi:hypothetical protein ACLX1H_003092 [Fusarium chlamydosporum]